MPVTLFGIQSQDASALIDEVLAAYGKPKQVTSVKSYRLEADMLAHSRGEKAAVVRIVEGPDRLKVLIDYRSSAEIRVLDNDKAWRGSSPENLAGVQGPMLRAMTLQAARANLPWFLNEMRSRVVMDNSQGESRVLNISVAEGLLLKVFLDENSHRVLASESVMRAGSMTIKFHTDYSDFRKVDGVLFPFNEENYASGVHTASVSVRKIHLNPPESDLVLPTPRTIPDKENLAGLAAPFFEFWPRTGREIFGTE